MPQDVPLCETELKRIVAPVDEAWLVWTMGDSEKPLPRPVDWDVTVFGFLEAGLPIEEMLEAVKITMRNDRLMNTRAWAYFRAICRNRLDKHLAVAQALVHRLADEVTPPNERAAV